MSKTSFKNLQLPAKLTAQGILLRSETEKDFQFLEYLYASIRWQELEVTGWARETKVAFLRQQFSLQYHHYAVYYADADFGILVHGAEPIGRIYLHRSSRELRVVDVSLIPEWRGRGIGTILLQAVFAEASSLGATVSIHVEHLNPARKLYERLGFREKNMVGLYRLMVWTPEKTKAALDMATTCPAIQ